MGAMWDLSGETMWLQVIRQSLKLSDETGSILALWGEYHWHNKTGPQSAEHAYSLIYKQATLTALPKPVLWICTTVMK